ncbi:lipocalin [Streptomyces spiroverticillatus]|uniref:Lipocalin n=1 Tax=Streptomyces finlayi TaxID=67296 RepID=A0A918X8X8_9ACTN|nr:lipocalin family protein [Streptomyces finlayi]GHA44757.1 lipocalin [Streptomyces spiroverticillatus]GHD17973.1 lipocalin [Streptomyces finlayi]
MFPLRARVLTLCTAAALTALVSASPASASGTDAPERLDIGRYAGDWYQVAAVPQLFELQCKKNVRAQYAPTARGTVSVRNTCTTWWGSTSAIGGEAKPLDARATELNVSFVPAAGGGYRHTRDANYRIVGLASDYSWAAVTDSDLKSGFILSRTPRLDTAARDRAAASLQEAGVNPCTLLITRQDGGELRPKQLC